ncbi:MAG: hypothetical protein R3242_11310 [Akkermansiaceae bacterium]|nr:hypothetical protein [Akkermansiaceae bacterium]
MAMAAEWKKEILNTYPELQVESRNVADEENGYLQLLGLKNHSGPTSDLAAIYELFEGKDPQVAKRALEKNAAWVTEVTRIARLDQRSNHGIADAENYEHMARIKQAAETLMLQAWVQASDGDEPAALESMNAASTLIGHLIDLEYPFLLNETVAVVICQGQRQVILTNILTQLGPQADLRAWRQCIERHPPTVERFKRAILGEWRQFADVFAAETLFGLHLQRRLVDPHETATAITRQVIEMSRNLKAGDLKSMETFCHGLTEPDLSPEGMAWTEGYLHEAWARGYIRAARMHARSLAAIDLLILESEQDAIDPSDMKRATKDPYTGLPFILDPQERTVSCPGPASVNDAYGEHEPLKLPW